MAARRGRAILFWGLAAVFVLRLATMGLYPLTDTTEARYGEMARLMAHTGNWLTPQFSEGVPFWGKPPLAFWASAGAAKIFAINEFSLRLPSALFFAVGLLLTSALIAPYRGHAAGIAAGIVASTTVLGFVAMGAIWTDVALLVSTALVQTGLWKVVVQRDRRWAYAPFLGVGIAMLAKGPVGVVLPGIAVFFWCCWQRRWAALWRELPWLSGTALTLLIFLPWYWAAERATPGFLDYFIVGEHIARFLTPDWSGDLYGTAHVEARGTIWWFAVLSFFPWSLVLAWSLWRKGFSARAAAKDDDGLAIYLLCWLMAPMLLFTLARNILPTYVLPALPALSAWLVLRIFEPPLAVVDERRAPLTRVFLPASVMPALYLVALLLVAIGTIQLKSQKPLIEVADRSGADVCYLNKVPFSGNFYSRGKAITAVQCPPDRWVAGRHAAVEAFLAEAASSGYQHYRAVYQDRRYTLLAPGRPQ